MRLLLYHETNAVVNNAVNKRFYVSSNAIRILRSAFRVREILRELRMTISYSLNKNGGTEKNIKHQNCVWQTTIIAELDISIDHKIY